MLLTAASFLQPVSATGVASRLTFWVVGPDGLPAVEPYVMVSVVGPTMHQTRQSRGGADGRVQVEVPTDDPEAAARIAEGRPVDLFVQVFDEKPGSPGINAFYAVTGVNVGGALDGLPVDVGDVNGRVHTMRPHFTDFVELGVDEPHPDEPDCPPGGQGATPDPCTLEDWPLTAYNTWVTVADNFGGGRDFTATMRYESSEVTTTSTAVGVGVKGFAEVGGRVTHEKEVTQVLGFNPVGHGANRRAYVVSSFKRIRSGSCWHDPFDGKRHCQITTVYKPYQPHGNDSDLYFGLHDQLDPLQDCWTPIDGEYSKGKGVTAGMSFNLTLTPNEQWSKILAPQGASLHATSTVTADKRDGKSFIRKWDVDDSPEFDHHYMFVNGGLERYNRLQAGGGPGACVENSVPDAWTAATDNDIRQTPPVKPYVATPCDPQVGGLPQAEPEVPGVEVRPCL